MNPFAALGMLFWLVIIVLAVCSPLVLFLSYRKLAGIERALWAIRSELERARSVPPREAPGAVIAREAGTASPSHGVVLSQFGR